MTNHRLLALVPILGSPSDYSDPADSSAPA